MTAPKAAIALNNLTVSYRQHPALHHLSGQFAQGSLTAIMGPNGSGKSTLLKSLVGLLPAQGSYSGGHALSVQGRIAYLPQVSDIDRSFPLDVQDCVLLGSWSNVGAMGRINSSCIDAALAAVGLQGFERRSLGTLSSGQLQRVMFARLLVQNAQIILLDEPFNALDSKTTAHLLLLVQQWHQQQRTVLVVLHDEAQARQYFPQTLLLARELVAWGRTADVLTPAHLQQARAMAEAWDERAELCRVDA